MRLTPSPVLAAVLAAAAALCAETADPLRLARTVEPVAQAVELDLDPARDDFTGRVRLDVVVHEAAASFRLHAVEPVITRAALTDAAGRSVTLAHAVTEPAHGLVTFTAPAPLAPGAYVLELAFTNKFNRAGLGLYKTVSRGDAYLFTQFEDRYARKAFPCFDEPSFKIPWQLTVTVPEGLEVVSNNPPAQESRAGGRKTVAFGRTPPMPSYLVALAVGPLEYVPVPGLPVPGRIITPRGQAALAAEAVRLTPPLFKRLETYFGLPYPYAKLDQIAVPEYVFGAMENAGLITYRDSLLLIDPAHPPFSARRSLANVIAHETAHMWFGDLVTMAWWDDLWLNESFADWICIKVTAEAFPEFRLHLQQVTDTHVAMHTDAQPSVLTVRRRITGADDPEQFVDELTYNKGKAVLGMVENWIGPETFRRAMRAYFLKHRWGNTTSADLWAAFDESSGRNISALLATFIDQPGIPVVDFTVTPEGRLHLAQRRFANLGVQPPARLWQVPVTFKWSARGVVREERVLLTAPEQTVEIPGLAGADWIYPNAGESGYYRWTLPAALNARLAIRAATVLSPGERLGLLDNVAALLDAGRLTGGDYLAYLAAFASDPEPEVTQKVIAGLDKVHEVFVTPGQEEKFHAFTRALLSPALARIGVKPTPGEPAHIAPLRNQLYRQLGRELADPAVITAADELARQYLENPAALDASLADAALEVAAYHGDATLFDRVRAAVEQNASPNARRNFIGTLGGFHDLALVDRALDYSLTPALNSTEFLRVAYATAGLPGRRRHTVEWARAHFDAIKAKAPPQRTAGLITLADGGDTALFAAWKDFLLTPERTTQSAAINAAKTGDRVTLRQLLRERELASFDAYLATFPGRAPADRTP
ncbi:MAG: M1 family metallopeptidase [Opitutae bacterium]|nr:M1 family metallopeptidase [Opitutae bacterium]